MFSKLFKQGQTVIFSLSFLLIVAIMSWNALLLIERKTRESVRGALQTVLMTTHESMLLWVEHRKNDVLHVASDTEFKRLTKQLLLDSEQDTPFLHSESLRDIRTFLGPILKEHNDRGYSIISPAMINIASQWDVKIGVTNLIYMQRKERIKVVFKGDVTFIPTIRSGVPIKTKSGQFQENLPTFFVVAPIKDDSGQVIAALAFHIDPAQHFSKIVQLGRLGKTGETYIFDKEGIMLTESRFDHHLKLVNLIQADSKGILSIRISDPGENLSEGPLLQAPLKDRPLTVMARSALQGFSDYNIEGYRDYRGVKVFGVWLWDQSLGFGVTSEIDEEEALRLFNQTRNLIVAVILATVFLSFILISLLMRFQILSEKRLKTAYNELDFMVQKRTKSLNVAKEKLVTANRQLEVQATTDSLTGLANRRQFDQHLSDEIRRSRREKKALSLLMIDIDCFKNYNDFYGHQAGDHCLKEVALLMKLVNVTNRPGDLIARYGGEEFCFILSGVSKEHAVRFAEQICEQVRSEKIEHKESKIKNCQWITLSIGVTTALNCEGITARRLISHADQALYKAKSNGRDRIFFYEP